MKKYKYTFLSLMFVVLFLMGSMAAANAILKRRETRLLSERGGIKVESPVRAWEGGENGDEGVDGIDTNDKKNLLSMEQAEEAVKSWNDRTGVTLHGQVAGQVSMEEAIEHGKKWLDGMGIGDGNEEGSFGINAELGVGRQKEDTEQREAYFSFWTVTYFNQSMNAVLYLNAVTGNVWGAEIKLYEEQAKKMPDGRLRLFVELAGFQAADEVSPAMDSEETTSEVKIKESQLYAQEMSYAMAVWPGNSYEYIAYQLLVRQP